MRRILGILRSGGLIDADRAFLTIGAQLLSHRGPDDQGIWTDSQVGFAHRRLSILDLSSGGQPMRDVTGRYIITFNGEVYNYKELRSFLEAKNYAFRTKSDPEVILNAFAYWGNSCVEHLNGIFAFGIWDNNARKLFRARDHLGVKPLLYYASRDCFIFASDLPVILRHPAVQMRINLLALSDYLSLGYVLAPKTIVQGVCKLLPATWLEWEGNGVRCQNYWDLANIANQPPRQFASEKQAVEQLQAELERVVSWALSI